MAQHNEFGRWGEDVAEKYLYSEGYTICHRDWRYGHRDLDIVAYDGEELVFIEVKTRRNEDYCSATDSVDERKINNLIQIAETYVNLYKVEAPIRFDVITVVGKFNGSFSINHIKNAFLP